MNNYINSIIGITIAIIITIVIAKKIKFSHYFFNYLWSVLGKIFEYQLHPYKEELFKQANGVVLDVGSGTGPTFRYLKPSKESNNKINRVIAIEPNHFMYKKLKDESKVLDNIPCDIFTKTIEEAIKDGDLINNSIDTIICNLVLCSIPQPQQILYQIQNLLKPNGKLLFVEHVVSTNKFNKLIQYCCAPFWSLAFDGCCITNDTASYIKSMKGWSEVKIGNAKGPFFKYIQGYAIKN